MYIYNVTVNIDEEVHDEWLSWMKDVHIPDVMATGLFLSNKILEVLADDPQGVTYSIQYEFKSLDDLEEYREKHAESLQKEHLSRYEGRFVAFRTILRVEHQSDGQGAA